MKKMIAVKSHQATQYYLKLKFIYQEHHWNQKKVRDVRDATLTMAEGVVPLRNLVMKVRETVMVLLMGASMMEIRVVKAH